jgi:hypothetical protein
VRLRDLDERFVPLAAARVRRWVAGLAVQRTRVLATKADVSDIRPKDLDARYAGRGPLAMVREIPQIGFVLIGAVFMAGTATAVVRHQQQPAPAPVADSPALTEPTVPASNRLGPDVGQTTEDYERTSHDDLEQVAGDHPDSVRLALVTFSDYRTPAQVLDALGGYGVRRVYLRAKDAGPEAAQLPYEIRGQLGPSLRKAYADIALSRLELRRSYLAYVATTKNDKAYHDDYQRYADSAGREVKAYQKLCACVFSAVVEAPAGQLLDLWTNPDIRSVQVAGRGAELADLLVLPLQPETTGLVTKGPETPAPQP